MLVVFLYDRAHLRQNLSKNPYFEVQAVFDELILDKTRQNRRATRRFTEDFNAVLDKISHQKPGSIRSRVARAGSLLPADLSRNAEGCIPYRATDLFISGSALQTFS